MKIHTHKHQTIRTKHPFRRISNRETARRVDRLVNQSERKFFLLLPSKKRARLEDLHNYLTAVDNGEFFGTN